MKKYFIVVLLICLGYRMVDAQNTYPWPTTGSIGIGTTTPSRTLHVLTSQTNGGVRITQTTSGFSALELYNTTTTPANGAYGSGHNWGIVSTGANNIEGGGAFGIYDFTPPLNGYKLFIKSDGKIGLGTTNPLTRLHTVGDFSLFSSTISPTTAAVIRGNSNFSSATTPDYTWYGVGNDQTGIYHPSANTIGFSTAGSEKMTITNDNNVIFGSPSNMFNTSIGQASNLDFGTTYLGFNAVHNPTNNTWDRKSNGGANGGAVIWASINGQISFSSLPIWDAANPVPNTAGQVAETYRVMRMRYVINTGPQVIIGSEMPGWQPDFMLSVNGKIVAKSLYVTQQGWADYVFDEDYTLMTLDSLENYIETHKHLPNVPTTEEVLRDGNNTGETDKILLEKIEELTLYVIELKKEIELLKKDK